VKQLTFIGCISIALSSNYSIAKSSSNYHKSYENCALNSAKTPYFFWENDLPYYLEEKTFRKCGLMYKKENIFDRNKPTINVISYGDSYEWVS
jgi:hypothetical protein